MFKQKQTNRPYVAPKVTSVSFNVEVGLHLSGRTSDYDSETNLLDPTSSSSPNAADGGSSTQEFFQYNW